MKPDEYYRKKIEAEAIKDQAVGAFFRANYMGYEMEMNKLKKEDLKLEIKSFKDSTVPAIMTLSEQSRRMQEIYKSYGQQFAGMSNMFTDEYTLVINSNNEIIKKLESMDTDSQKLVCEHIYDLAMLCNKPLDADAMTKFVERSSKILEKII